ncbi:aminodeoxychorismate synthase component I [Pseudidiomarina woesei]|uniref:aminodeoxychorismate synthase n=1 Tax=Pseudidiomarina woesei TaxID=1381080 RepID=A0A0K6H115_9GAMM|nr:aminodeoxychorismate synthase component I [Pseudidiomarina woesei]CUA84667.1 aminodeoxychorismate synthase, subunit I [Pseudidiomarina woesei]
MPLVAVQLPIKSPLAEVFERCAHEPWALLLDSCNSAAGQWDMIFRQPMRVVTDINDWPSQLAALLAQTPSYQGPRHLPFQGGLAGAWSYDAGRALEQLPTQAEADIALPDIAVGLYTQALMQERATGATWLLAEASQTKALSDYWLSAEQPAQQSFTLKSAWQSNMTAEQYADKFKQVQNYLLAGDCYQVNLAQRFQANYQGNTWAAYQNLRAHNNAPFSAFFKLPQGALLSLSPERFLAIDANGHVETKPIKGTRPRQADPHRDKAMAEALQHSSKDRAENVMIVDLLRNDLSRVCKPGSVKVPKLFAIESYPAVHHLVSTVVGELADTKQAIHLLAQCFPGGSITGAPKIRAMEVIDELEPHRRSYYCGSFGYFSQHGHADTNIAIRTLVAVQQNEQVGHIYCWAGGGLVADSECAAEYQETFDKVARILPVLSTESPLV